ncbi:hypothetical protein [Kribbella endophytica]
MSTAFSTSHRHQDQAHLVCRFAHQLSVVTNTSVSARRGPGAGWQITWYDGPSVASMRRYVAILGSAVAGVDVSRLIWLRLTAPSDTGKSSSLSKGSR